LTLEEHVLQLGDRLTKEGQFAPLIGGLPGSSELSNGAVALIEDPERPLSPMVSAPDSFAVVALMVMYNESDILRRSVQDLTDNGVDGVYLIDNWSTDGSYEIAESMRGNEVIGLERYPPDGATEFFDLRSILLRMEEIGSVIGADWLIKHDVDEARRGPWAGVSLRDAIYRVDVAGFNRVDFTILNFAPVDNGYEPGADFVSYFQHFDWARHPAHFLQLKGWKRQSRPVSLAASAAHKVDFEGARTFPYKFLMFHYPIRSQSHGERKIFADRKPRLLPEARARGWHNHYDRHLPGESFLREPDQLMRYDSEFANRYFVERLTGVNVERETIEQPEGV
jgi:hypothetical protein